MMEEAKERCIATCLFCSSLSQTELDKTSPWYLAVHTCHLHVDKKRDGPSLYACQVINEIDNHSTPCAMTFLTLDELIEHMESEHPNEEIPFHFRYKATMSNFLAECSVMASLSASPGQPLPIPNQTKSFHQMCDYVLCKRKNMPNLNPETPNSEEANGSEQSMETDDGGSSSANPPAETLNTNIDATDTISTTTILDSSVQATNEVSANLVSSTTSTEDDVDGMDSSGSSESSSPAAPLQQPEPSSSIVSQKPRLSGRGRSVFTSDNYRGLQKRLKARYPKISKNGTKNGSKATCSKCGMSIIYGSDPRGNPAIRHVMTYHLSQPPFSCKLCDRSYNSYSAWYVHFTYSHSEQKKETKNGRSIPSDYHIDRRNDLEEEIVRVASECFL